MTPLARAAVRWALYAEKLSVDLPELRAAVERTPHQGMSGREMQEFMGNRAALRESLTATERLLYPAGDA